MQKTALLAANESAAPVSTAGQTYSAAMAAHPIESELLENTIPRKIIASSQVRMLAILSGIGAVLIVAVLSLLAVLFHNGPMSAAVGAGGFAVYSVLRYFLTANSRRHGNFLAYGIAKPAVVTQSAPNADGTQVRVHFMHEAQPGRHLVDTITLTSQHVSQFDLKRGQTFTLLADPANENNVLPYFLICAYTLATPPGASVPTASLRHQLRTTPTPQGAIMAEAGVEPELYSGTPRRVSWKRATNQQRLVFANCLATVYALIFYFFPGANQEDRIGMTCLCVGTTTGLIGWIWQERQWWRSRRFLRDGYAVRAKVAWCGVDELSGNLRVKFGYTRNGKDTAYRDIVLVPSLALRLGGMKPGTTFTALRHPTDPHQVMPYFQLEGVEVPGSTTAQVISPTP